MSLNGYQTNYDDTMNENLGYHFVEQAIRPVSGKRVLDFGFGPGKFSGQPAEQRAQKTFQALYLAYKLHQ